MEILTGNNIIVALLVVVAVLEFYNLVSKATDNYRAARKREAEPTQALSETLEQHAKWLHSDKRRMEEFERRLDELEQQLNGYNEGQKALCTGVMALLEHELHNGNTVEMEDASRKLNDWLVNK